jgi:hypothetical protein
MKKAHTKVRRLTVSFLLPILFSLAHSTKAQVARSLDEKLQITTEFQPKTKTPREQLVEVAQQFKIPMAIEWFERDEPQDNPNEVVSKAQAVNKTVLALIKSIIAASGARTEVEGGLLRIYSPALSMHPSNFLNIALQSYEVRNAHLFDADDVLRWAIRFAIEPEKYRNGFSGGYGFGSPEVFQISKFSVSCSNVTIREILNRVALAQGNVGWIATIKSYDFDRYEPFWKRGSDAGDLPLTSRWHYFPLSDLAELAKENLAVDIAVQDFDQRRVFTIPVFIKEKIAGTSGTTGVSSSEGVAYTFAGQVEEIGTDSVTLAINMTVTRDGEDDFKFEGKLKVVRGQVTEVKPEERVQIKAYIETSKASEKP